MAICFGNYVDGAWIDSTSGELFEVRNPADTTDLIGYFQQSTAEDAAAAAEAAAAAQDGWASTPPSERGAILTETAGRLKDHRAELAIDLTREEGKTPSEATSEVQRVIDIFRYYGQKARDVRGTVKSASSADTTLYTIQEPVGVAALVTPWNYPIGIPAWKLAPALAMGNTAVLKPASQAPNTLRQVFEALDASGLPDGVANFVTGTGPDVAAPLVEHASVDAVSFTGSTPVGEGVYREAVPDGKRVQTELGGKNPTIVMPSADLDRATEIVGRGAFGGTGQSCTACSRAIVHQSIHDQFLARIVDYANSISVGARESADMGPHASEAELEGTLEYVEVGQREGAVLETGGSRLTGDRYDDGYFVSPAVFSGVESQMRIAQEEIFGPVLSVIEVNDMSEAMAVANDVEYGLSASIVTNDQEQANRFIEEIEAGVAKVNDKTTGLEPHIRFGGVKRSSSETWREQGDGAIEFYTISKTVYESF
jgi:2,5-dioxopentanoate dehydrogenase